MSSQRVAAKQRAGRSGGQRGFAFTFIDLFAGIGGFHLGMSALGGTSVFANEWDRYAAKTYVSWTGHEINTSDVRSLNYRDEIPVHDVLCAGFPCQPFSLAGVSKKNSLGRPHGFQDQHQGNLFFAIRDIAQARRPLVLLLENVKNLRSHDQGKTWARITQIVDDLGYELRFKLVDASGWVPQRRERIFLVAFLRSQFLESEIDTFEFPAQPKAHHVLAEVLEERPDARYMLSDALWAYLQEYAEKHRLKGNGFGYGLFGPGDTARTLSARYHKDGSEILIKQPRWRNPRRLTPLEAARLMGFGARYARLAGFKTAFPQVVSDTQAYRQLGNAVCPPVVEAVGAGIIDVLRLRQERLADRSNRSVPIARGRP